MLMDYLAPVTGVFDFEPIACCDWLQFSTNIIDSNMQQELNFCTAVPLRDKFYKWSYDTPNYNVRTGKKNGKLRSAIVKLKHEFLPYIEETGLPKDYNLTRCDICFDCPTLDIAMQFVTLEYSSVIYSTNNNQYGNTWYFGSREGQLFERVYFKQDAETGAQFWRYELEIKPKSKDLPMRRWLRIDERIRQKYTDINLAFRNDGRNIDEFLKKTISHSRQQELNFLATCKYIDISGIHRAIDDMNDLEREFIYHSAKIEQRINITAARWVKQLERYM